MPGASTARIEASRARAIASRCWASPPVIVGFGGAASGPLPIPHDLRPHVAQAPFAVTDSSLVSGRSPGAEALLAAVGLAMEGLDPAALPPPRERALVVGTRTAALDEVVNFIEEVQAVGAHLVNPGLFPFVVMNAAAGLAAIHYRFEGPNLTLNSGATSALEAVAYAADLLAEDRARIVLAGGFESLGPFAGTAFGRSQPPVTVAAVLALMAPPGVWPQCGSRLLAGATDHLPGLAAAAARNEVAAAALAAVRSREGLAACPAETLDAGTQPESTLLALLAAAQRAAASSIPSLVAVAAADSTPTAPAALVFGSASCAPR